MIINSQQNINIINLFFQCIQFLRSFMDIIGEVQAFIASKQFWIYHGFVLSGLWVLLSSVAIFAKRISIQIHLLLFAIIDFTTVFFAGAALYRVSGGFPNFMEWSLLKQSHVVGGALFLGLVIIQHIGGVSSYLLKKPNPQHRSFGKILVNIGRVVAGVGWIFGGNLNNAIIVGVVSIVMIGLALVVGPAKKPVSKESGSQGRSKSPRAAKRE